MHSIRSFINQNRHRRIRPRVRHMLHHFFHDQRIPDQKPHGLRRFLPLRFPQYFAEIESHEFHQARRSQPRLNYFFHFRVRLRRADLREHSAHIRMPHARRQLRHDLLKFLRRHQAKPLHANLSRGH